MSSEALEKYRNLVLRKEKLLKDARNIELDYIRVFGDLLEREYSAKIECIRLKKTIEFCQARLNRGEEVFKFELDAYIDETMASYYATLETITEIKNSKPKFVPQVEYFKIKKVYHRLAMAIHPDLHPELSGDEELARLWERITTAYKSNNYEELLSLELLVAEAVKRLGLGETELSVENVEAKIAVLQREIYDILHTDPYRLKELLDDAEASSLLRTELETSIKEHEEYLSELQVEAAKFDVEGLGA